jgi:hypothetical protein
MKQTDELYPLIEAYLEGHLSESDKANFDTRRGDDPVLNAAILEFETIRRGIEAQGKHALRQKISIWETGIKRKEKRIYLFRWAAVFVGLAVAGLVIGTLLWPGENDTKQLAQSYFEPYPALFAERNHGAMNTVDSLLYLYNKGSYGAAVKLIEGKRINESEEAQLIRFYLGESALASKDYKLAINSLAGFGDRENALFEVARFHHALALLLQGESIQAQNALQIIHTEKGPYRLKAGEILIQLETSGAGE